MKKNIILAMVASGLIAGFAVSAMAQEKAKENAPDEEKIISSATNKITGQIGSINKSSISVVYKRDDAKGEEFEMLFPIDKNLRIVHKKSIRELAVGDTVEVEYEDVTIEKKDRNEGKRNTAVITFVSPAETPAEPVATHGDTITTDTNTTTESTSVAPLKSDLR